MGFVNFVVEAFDIFVREFTNGELIFVLIFAFFLFLVLCVLFLVFFSLLKKGIKPFLIFWGIILAANVFLAIYGADADQCHSSWETFGSCFWVSSAIGFANMLFWLEFIPPITFLLFNVLKPSSFSKTLIISAVSSLVIVCGLWGVVLFLT